MTHNYFCSSDLTNRVVKYHRREDSPNFPRCAWWPTRYFLRLRKPIILHPSGNKQIESSFLGTGMQRRLPGSSFASSSALTPLSISNISNRSFEGCLGTAREKAMVGWAFVNRPCKDTTSLAGARRKPTRFISFYMKSDTTCCAQIYSLTFTWYKWNKT